MKTLALTGQDVPPYKEWQAKLRNCYLQARPGAISQNVWAWMEEKANKILQDARTGGEVPRESLQATPEERTMWGLQMQDLESFDEDLAAVLIDKTAGTLHVKTVAICDRARNERKRDGGLRAYFEIHTWFMRTTGLKLSERMRSLMKPQQAKSE